MTDRFDRSGIAVTLLEGWQLDVAEEGTGWTATIQSPGTAFAILSLQPDADDPAQLADLTLESLTAEYPGLESDDRVEQVAGQVAIGCDVDFLAFDTAVSGMVRAIESPDGPLLILTQCSEMDRREHEPGLRSILSSLVITEGDDSP